eukprot:GEMP01010337.1.p1 GENE.GEMP01010337.1~~GEMP01010337.1.p1  ORF type:complete len:821 (+),score=192.84 GEMP01010337.1:68-2530(+)
MTVHFVAQIEDQVRVQHERRPGAAALKWEENDEIHFLTYRQMWDITARGANYLTDIYGSKGVYWVCVADRHQFALAELAVLRVGTLIPIDPKTPIPRLQSLSAECPVKCCITDQTAMDFPVPTVRVDKLWRWNCQSRKTTVLPDISHIFFTSGSTGNPKGVQGTARSLSNYALAKNKAHHIDETSCVLGASPPTFDPSLGDLISALCAGATFACGGPVSALRHQIFRFAVTHLQTSPSTWFALDLPFQGTGKLQCVALGGEPFPAHGASSASGETRVLNTYGVTECCVYQMFHRVQGEEDCRFLGDVLDGNTWRVENDELVLGGIQVAAGYVNRDELTKEKFRNGEYYTGDVVGQKPDGNWEVRGRRDFQVKVRGVRIELEEIESVVPSGLSWAKGCFCYVEDAKLHLVVDPVEGDTDILRYLLLHFLTSSLPATHHPHEIHFGSIGLNLNGKIDRAQRFATESVVDSHFADPNERRIALRWSADLGRPLSTLNRNWTYSETGGDSLSALRIGRRFYADEGHEITDQTGILPPPFDFLTIMETSLKDYHALLVDAASKGKCDGGSIHDNYSTIHGGALPAATHDEDKSEGEHDAPEHPAAAFVLRSTESNHKLVLRALLKLYTPQVAKRREKTRSQRRQPNEVRRYTSALHIAARRNFRECMKILLEACPSMVMAANNIGELPLHHCRSPSSIALLLSYSCPLTVRDNNLQTIVHACARRGDHESLEYVLPRWLDAVRGDEKSLKVFGTYVDWRDRWHRTPLAWACLNAHVECARLLLEARADADARVKDGKHAKDTRLLNESPREIALRVGFTLPVVVI